MTNEHTREATKPGGTQRGAKHKGPFRWRGIFALLFFFALILIWWLIFGERTVRNTLAEAATTSLGTQVDIGSVDIQLARGSVILNGVAVADPFDSLRNLLEADDATVELELEPLLTKRIVVRDLQVHGITFGTTRDVPARRVDTAGFAPRALREIQRFREQIDVPLLSLTPIDTIRSLVLDPSQLRSVQSATSLVARADSLRGDLVGRADALARTDVIDSAEALLGRLRGQSIRSLGVTGTLRAVRDVRRLVSAVDSLKRGVDDLRRDTRGSFDSVVAATRAVDDARRADYAFARSLLQLPTFDAPSIGPALFGEVSVTTFEKAGYWVSLAREHAPPGLLPRRRAGPKRLRRDGTDISFVTPESGPDFLLRAAEMSLTLGEQTGAVRGAYALSVRDLTTAPALLGRPATFELSRSAAESDLPEIRLSGSLDHSTPRPHDIIRLVASDVRLPDFGIPGLPLELSMGRGASELRFEMRGDSVAARLSLATNSPRWVRDTSRADAPNTLENLVMRVLERIGSLQVQAELHGTLATPRLSVRSNIDRAVADAVRGVLGEEVAEAERKVRAQVDSIAEATLAPVRARVNEARAEAEAQVNQVSARVDAVQEQLLAQLRALGG
ncbi:MAG TPA: TIGR03545 family protein [Gemmatimonadaceae bacterium]|nr:TIGR03545 family protein [Gemmatimonadaceae bacterium]